MLDSFFYTTLDDLLLSSQPNVLLDNVLPPLLIGNNAIDLLIDKDAPDLLIGDAPDMPMDIASTLPTNSGDRKRETWH